MLGAEASYFSDGTTEALLQLSLQDGGSLRWVFHSTALFALGEKAFAK